MNLKYIAIVDLCRPSDVHPEQFNVAAIRKQEGYLPLEETLDHHYKDSGRIVHFLQWVVGIQVLRDPANICSLLDFLVHRKHRETAAEQTVLASVKALYSMHQVRFGGLYGRQSTDSR